MKIYFIILTVISFNRPLFEIKQPDNIFGLWVIKNYAFRHISAVDDETAKSYIGDTILITLNQLKTPFNNSNTICYFDSIKKTIIERDDDFSTLLNSPNYSLLSYEFYCNKHSDFFYLTDNVWGIYELDGALYLCERID